VEKGKTSELKRMLFVPGEITTREHCYDRVEPLVKHPNNPVMVPEHPWEGKGVYYPCVLYSEIENIYKMWYFTEVEGERKHQKIMPKIDNAEIKGRMFICYATSTDGLSWQRPQLARFTLQGSNKNNVVFPDGGFILGCVTVIEDMTDPDSTQRYKMLYYDNDGEGRDGIRTAVSANGMDWTYVGEFPVLPSQDTPSLWHDRRRGQYVAFLKDRLDNRRARTIAVSKDFIRWSDPAISVIPDMGDPPTLHFYAQNAFHHCGHDFAFLNRFNFDTQKLDMELIVSPQGNDWRRLPTRPVVLSPGNPGNWDGEMILNGFGEPIVHGDRCWYYYYGSSGRHDEHAAHGAVGIATFTSGRLVGQQFEDQGFFASLPFRCPGGTLTLDAIAKQPIAVEVCSPGYGSPLDGFRQEDCVCVQGDSNRHAIRWKEKTNLDELRGNFILLRVYGCDSIVYGATFST
jgi:hypothetical protein